MQVDLQDIKGVIFDLDGTLVESELDFGAMRKHLGCPADTDILTFIETLPDAQSRQYAHDYIVAQELCDAKQATWLEPGKQILEQAMALALPVAIVTRNCRQASQLKIANNQIPVPLVLTREDAPAKPDPTALLQVARQWGIAPEKCLYVGDFIYDEQAAERAGMQFVLV